MWWHRRVVLCSGWNKKGEGSLASVSSEEPQSSPYPLNTSLNLLQLPAQSLVLSGMNTCRLCSELHALAFPLGPGSAEANGASAFFYLTLQAAAISLP